MKFRLAAAVALIYNSSRTSCYSSRNIIFRPEVSQMISLKISFRISFQYILVRRADLNIKSQDLSHLVPIWSTLGTNQISLLLYRSTLSSTSLGRGRERTRERGRWGGGEVTVKRERRKCWCGETREEWLPLAVPRTDWVGAGVGWLRGEARSVLTTVAGRPAPIRNNEIYGMFVLLSLW